MQLPKISEQIILELLYGTGIRLSELLGLKVSDFKSSESTIKVLGKRNKERIIPVSKRLNELLKTFQYRLSKF